MASNLLDYLDSLGSLTSGAKKFKSLARPGAAAPVPAQAPDQPQLRQQTQPRSAGNGMGQSINDMFAGWAQGGNDWQRSLALGAANVSQMRQQRQQEAFAQTQQQAEAMRARQQSEALRQSAVAAGLDPNIVSGLDDASIRQLIAADFTNDNSNARFQMEQASKQKDEAAKTEKELKAEQELRTWAARNTQLGPQAINAPIEVVKKASEQSVPGMAGPNVDDELKLSKDFENQPGVSAYRKIQPMLQSMAESLKDPSAVADLDFIYGVAKILDPNSVVREGEMVLVQSTNNLPDYIKGALQKAISGESALTPGLRQKMYNLAQRRGASLHQQALDEYQNYRDRATAYKMDPSRALRGVENMPHAFQGPFMPDGVDPAQSQGQATPQMQGGGVAMDSPTLGGDVKFSYDGNGNLVLLPQGGRR